MKSEGQRIVALTAYDYLMARILDDVGVDILLVGDSVASVFSGQPNTLPVTVDEMVYHTRAVARGARRSLVVMDMPFLSYQPSVETAVTNCGRALKEGGAEAVKLEGGVGMAETIRRLTEIGIPVMGHIGLTPQSIHRMGGYKVQGRTEPAKRSIMDDALAVEAAGAFSIVLEGIPSTLASEISRKLAIPTIGIGAGSECDGQILVVYDMLGMFDEFSPKFVKRYAELRKDIEHAVGRYSTDVRSGKFPGPEQSFSG